MTTINFHVDQFKFRHNEITKKKKNTDRLMLLLLASRVATCFVCRGKLNDHKLS